ncbi:MAG: hypothetical protein ACYCZF_09070 [Anaerolineae bacterium]
MNKDKPVRKALSNGAQAAGLLALGLLVILSLFFSRAQIQPGQYQAENLPRTTGRVVVNLGAAYVREVCGKPGQTGALIYGPYDWYDTGQYQALFYLHIAATPGTVLGRVEVSDAKTGAILAFRDITATNTATSYLVYELSFALKQASQIEFRVWYYGSERFCIDQVITQSATGYKPEN